MGRHFPDREKSVNFEQAGKVRENHTKSWKIKRISNKYIICYFLVIVKCTVYHLPKWIKFSVKKQNFKNVLENGKNTGKVREFCQSGKVETMLPNPQPPKLMWEGILNPFSGVPRCSLLVGPSVLRSLKGLLQVEWGEIFLLPFLMPVTV